MGGHQRRQTPGRASGTVRPLGGKGVASTTSRIRCGAGLVSLTLDGVLFQEDLCSTLSMLHSYAPVHSFEYTRKEVEKALGQRIEDVFDSFDPEPIASGSIAQVRGGHWQAGHEEEQWRRRRRSPCCCGAVT